MSEFDDKTGKEDRDDFNGESKKERRARKLIEKKAKRIADREAKGKQPWELKSIDEQAKELLARMPKLEFKPNPKEEQNTPTTTPQKEIPPKAVDTAKVKREEEEDKNYRFHYGEVKTNYTSGRSESSYNTLMNRFVTFESSVGYKIGSRDFVNALTDQFPDIYWGEMPYLSEQVTKTPKKEGEETGAINSVDDTQDLSGSVGKAGENAKDDVNTHEHHQKPTIKEHLIIGKNGFKNVTITQFGGNQIETTIERYDFEGNLLEVIISDNEMQVAKGNYLDMTTDYNKMYDGKKLPEDQVVVKGQSNTPSNVFTTKVGASHRVYNEYGVTQARRVSSSQRKYMDAIVEIAKMNKVVGGIADVVEPILKGKFDDSAGRSTVNYIAGILSDSVGNDTAGKTLKDITGGLGKLGKAITAIKLAHILSSKETRQELATSIVFEGLVKSGYAEYDDYDSKELIVFTDKAGNDLQDLAKKLNVLIDYIEEQLKTANKKENKDEKKIEN